MLIQQITYERPHGNAMFPFSIWSSKGFTHDPIMYCNCHEDLEIIYVESGELLVKKDLSTNILQSGQADFVNKGVLHSGTAISGLCSFYAITFNMQMLCFKEKDKCQSLFIEPLLQGAHLLPSFISGKGNGDQYVLEYIRKIINSFDKKLPGFELMIKANLLNIIAVLYETGAIARANYSINDNYSERVTRLKKTFDYIENNYTNKIYIKDLAKQCGLSDCYFMKDFRALTGNTPVEYINAYRVRKAEKLLCDTNIPITDIAMNTGFGNISYFNKIFKKRHNFTPNEYRRQMLSL